MGVYPREMKIYVHAKACTNQATEHHPQQPHHEIAGGRGPEHPSALLAV